MLLPRTSSKLKRVYLDYAAATPLDPRALSVMQPYLTTKFGNPGSLHFFGQEAISALDAAREILSRSIGADFREIIFTSSATEANNLAILGAALGAREKILSPNIVISSAEHESVRESALALGVLGIKTKIIPVSREGVIDVRKILKAVDESTVLVSLIWVNNEVGSVNPISQVGESLKRFREKSPYPLFHTDAAQAFPFYDCDISKLELDLMTISSPKIYGPKGAGAIFMRNKIRRLISPIMKGGGQEFGFRSGTENLAAIVGFAEAARIASLEREKYAKRVRVNAHLFAEKALRLARGIALNGPSISSPIRAPHIVNLYFPMCKSESLLTKLDLLGVAASAGSACKSRGHEPSETIKALGFGEERARRSVRFSFGRQTSESQVDAALAAVQKSLREFKKYD